MLITIITYIRTIILNRKLAHSFFKLTCVIHLQSFPPFHETRKHCWHFCYSCEWAGNGDVYIYQTTVERSVTAQEAVDPDRLTLLQSFEFDKNCYSLQIQHHSGERTANM